MRESERADVQGSGPLKVAAFDAAKDLFPEKASFNERHETNFFRESAIVFPKPCRRSTRRMDAGETLWM
jgi:hypothetical protein